MGKRLCPSNRMLKTISRCGIGIHFRTIIERCIVLVELRLEHTQPIEFRKQIPRRFAHWSNWVLWMFFLPRREFVLRTREVEVIEPGKSTIERRVPRQSRDILTSR